MFVVESEDVFDSILPDIKNRVADFRGALWIAAQGIWRRRLALKNRCRVEDSTANCTSLPVPKNVTQIDPMTHFLEIFVWVLSVPSRQGRMHSAPIAPILPQGWTTGYDDTELTFKCGKVV